MKQSISIGQTYKLQVEHDNIYCRIFGKSVFYSLGKSGKFFRDGVEDRSSPESYDVDLQKDVWRKSCRLVNVRSMVTEDGFDDISLSSNKA